MTCGMCRNYVLGECAARLPMWAKLQMPSVDAGADASECMAYVDNTPHVVRHLIKEGVNNAVIARFTGKSEEAIRVKRYRMKKAGKI